MVVPFTITPTPMSGTFSLSETVPLTWIGLFWAFAPEPVNKRIEADAIKATKSFDLTFPINIILVFSCSSSGIGTPPDVVSETKVEQQQDRVNM